MGANTKASRPPPLSPDEADANVTRHHAGRAANRSQDGSKPTKGKSSGKPATGRHGHRWAAYNAFVDATLGGLGEAELRVWLILFRDVRDGVARTGMTDIARRAGLTRRGVVKAIAGLKRRRLVERVTRGTVNGNPNTYRVHGTA